jgi:hypothetical protein
MFNDNYTSEAEHLYDDSLGDYGDNEPLQGDEEDKRQQKPKKTRLECKQTDFIFEYSKINDFVLSEQKRLGYSDKWARSKFCDMRDELHAEKAKNFKKDKEDLLKTINTKKECVVACKRCGGAFVAKNADRQRGWGKYCSKSCKAQDQR